MNKYNLTTIALVSIMVLTTSCQAQVKKYDPNIPFDPYFVNSQTVISKHGPTNITRNILQDKKGNFWFASWEGIISYDGKVFTNHTQKEDLIKFHVFSLLEDSKGNLWFGTIRGGLYKYDGKSFTLFTTKDGLADDMVLAMLEDKEGNIWIGTDNGVSIYNDKVSIGANGKSFINYTIEHGLSGRSINSMIQDKSGKIWFASRYAEINDVSYIDSNASYYAGRKPIANFENKEGIKMENVRSIIEDKSGHIWMGGQSGLYRFDGTTMTKYSSNFIGYLYEDKAGNLWMCSGEPNNRGMSLYKYDQKSLLLNNGMSTEAKLIKKGEGQIFGITEDANGNIWFGTERGACRYNVNTLISTNSDAFNCFSE
jgi:ligand-binding sensor domain-containing protein